MKWSEWLARLPVLRTRRALEAANRELRASREENRRLRERLRQRDRRLQIEKKRRRRLEQRLARSGGSADADAPGARALISTPGLLVFEHIPKTAGSTFRRSYLTCALPRDQRWILAGGETNERDRRQLLSMPPQRLAALRVIAGHGAEALRPCLQGARFITLVRDPVDRAVSSYLHAMLQEGGDTRWSDVRRERLTLGEFVRRYEPPDAQSRILLGDDYAALDEEEMRKRLRSRYVLVGYTEAFAEFVFLLHETEGLPLCLFNNRLVRSERATFRPDPADLDTVRQMNLVDARLHAIVQEEFGERVRQLSPAARAMMERYRDAQRAFREETGGGENRAVRLDAACGDPAHARYAAQVFGRPAAPGGAAGSAGAREEGAGVRRTVEG